MVAEWAEWALTITEASPDKVGEAVPDDAAYQESVAIAERVERLRATL
jgi:hypothetical protein